MATPETPRPVLGLRVGRNIDLEEVVSVRRPINKWEIVVDVDFDVDFDIDFDIDL